MKKLILLFSLICLVSVIYSESYDDSFVVDLQRSDNARIDVTSNCIKIWNHRMPGSFNLCCDENFSKDIIVPYFDLRSGFENLKSDFREFTEYRRGCRWEKRSN